MVERIRSIKVRVEVDTNKRTETWEIEGVSFAELSEEVTKIFDEIDGMNE